MDISKKMYTMNDAFAKGLAAQISKKVWPFRRLIMKFSIAQTHCLKQQWEIFKDTGFEHVTIKNDKICELTYI